MKVRKLGAILLAGTLAAASAVVAVNTIPVVNAATAEENMVDLLTAELPDANVMNGCESLGDGFFLFNTKEGGTALVHLEKGENGELTYSNIKTDVELSKWKFGASNNERFVLSNADGEKRIMSLDKKNKEAKTVYTFESSRCTITDDNYVVFESDDNKISVIKPDGTKIETDKTIEIKSDVPNLFFNVNGKKYIAYYMDVADDNTSYKIYGLNREGKWTEAISTPRDWLEQKIGSFENTLIGSLGFFATNGNYILIAAFLKGTDGSPYAQPQYDFIDLSTNTLTVLSSEKTGGYFSVIDKNGILSDYAYGSLFNPRTQEYLENGYHPRTLDDGETYLINNEDWEAGFVDEKNNLISKEWYEGADAFCGDYAPVAKDGMGYLIDKKGNCVSEKIPAKWATTYSENLFSFDDDAGKCTLVYVDGSTTSVKPDDNSSNSGTSSGTGSDSSNSGTSSGTGSDSGNSGTSSGTGSDSGNSGTNSGTGSDSGNSGTSSGTGSDSGNSGTSSGTGSDSGNSGTSSGTGSDSGNSGTGSNNSGTSSDSNTSNSGADKENADTGFGGIAMTLGVVALAGAAIVVAKKKH